MNVNDIIDDIVFIHTSDGMSIRHYIDSTNWEFIKDLSCYHIEAKQHAQQDVGSANILSIPTGAKIFIDNKDTTFVTPNTITNISTGPHTYKLTYPGYTDIDGILFIASNEIYQLTVIMQKIYDSSNLSKLFVYSLGIGLFMVYLSQRKAEGKTEGKTETEE